MTFRDAGMNHVEAQVLDRVAMLYPDIFRALDEYCAGHRDYLDPTIAQIRPRSAVLPRVSLLRRAALPAGLTFCYPQVSTRSQEIYADDAFDWPWPQARPAEGRPWSARAFGWSGRSGSSWSPARIMGARRPSPGCSASCRTWQAWASRSRRHGRAYYLPDRLFSHFEREESLATLRGKLDDELVRIHDILAEATSR